MPVVPPVHTIATGSVGVERDPPAQRVATDERRRVERGVDDELRRRRGARAWATSPGPRRGLMPLVIAPSRIAAW